MLPSNSFSSDASKGVVSVWTYCLTVRNWSNKGMHYHEIRKFSNDRHTVILESCTYTNNSTEKKTEKFLGVQTGPKEKVLLWERTHRFQPRCRKFILRKQISTNHTNDTNLYD
jgi:hypothetical protein